MTVKLESSWDCSASMLGWPDCNSVNLASTWARPANNVET
jgi:hypothetical protein